MEYDTDDRFDTWMKEIIEAAWQSVQCYEEYLLDKRTSDELAKRMKHLYKQLPIDPTRKKEGKDKKKEDPM